MDVEIRFEGDARDAEAAVLTLDAALEQIDLLAKQVSDSLGDIKLHPGQAAVFVSEVGMMAAALSALEGRARSTNREMSQVGSYRPGTLLASAVTGLPFGQDRRTFAGGPAETGLVPYNPSNLLLQNRVFAQDAQYAQRARAFGGMFDSIGREDSYPIRYGAGMGGRIAGPLESYSDRGRGGLLGYLLGASSGGGGDRIGNILGGLGNDGGGGRRGGGGRYDVPGPNFLAGLLPGGARARPAALGALALGAASVTPDLGAPVVGALASIPALATTGVAALGTLALAFDGVSKAIGGNVKEYKGLNEEAQKFTLMVRGLDPSDPGSPLYKAKLAAQAGLFPGVTSGLQSFLSPATQSNVTNIAGLYGRTLGGIAGQTGSFLGSPQFQKEIGSLATAGAGGLQDLSHVLISLLDSFTKIGVAALPFTKWMGDMAVKGADLIDKFVTLKSHTGELGDFFVRLEGPSRLVAQLIENLAKLIYQLISVLAGGGNIALQGLVDLLGGMAGWLQKNHDALHELVSLMVGTFVGVLQTLAPLVSGIASALADMFKWADQLPGPLKQIVDASILIGVASLASGFGGMARAVGGLPGAIKLAVDGLKLLATNPEIAALLAAMAALGWLTSQSQPTVVAPSPVSGTTPGGANIVEQKGRFYIQGGSGGRLTQYTGLLPDGRSVVAGTVVSSPAGSTHDQGAPNRGPVPTGNRAYSQGDVLNLLLANGVPAGVAQNLATISARGEDTTGDPSRINNNASTGDYSVGLFQENFFGKLGPARVRQYAPQFGLSANMSVGAFTQWLGQHPDAQAKIAYQIYKSQGYGAWTTAAGLGIFGGPPSSTTPPWKPGDPPTSTTAAAAWQLPLRYQTMIARASTTPGTADDVTAINAAIHYLRGITKTLSGQDLVSAYNELASLQANLKSIATAAKSGRSSGSQRLSARNAGSSVLGLIHTALGPASGFLSDATNPLDILSSSPVDAAHDQLAPLLQRQRGEIQAFEKELRDKLISSEAVSTIRSRISAIRQAVTSELGQLKQAAQQQASDFKSVWADYVQTFDATFQQQTSDILAHPEKYPELLPLSAALADLQSQHTQEQLAQALSDAKQQLADALAGVSDTTSLDAARKKLGQDALAHAIDVAQSYVLGGIPMDMTDQIIRDMQAALTATTGAADPKAVAAAQRAVSEAEYNIKVDGLQKGATAEQTAYQDSRKELQKHLDESLAMWGTYYAKSGETAGEALASLNSLLVKFGFTPITDTGGGGANPFPQPGITTIDSSGKLVPVQNSKTSPAALFNLLQGRVVGMADGGLVTAPHFLVDMGGQVRGMIGEKGAEAISPVGRAMAGRVAGGDGPPIVVEVHTRDEALADFIDVRVVRPQNVAAVTRAQGLSANRRYRAGRF